MKIAIIIGAVISLGTAFTIWCCIRINHKED